MHRFYCTNAFYITIFSTFNCCGRMHERTGSLPEAPSGRSPAKRRHPVCTKLWEVPGGSRGCEFRTRTKWPGMTTYLDSLLGDFERRLSPVTEFLYSKDRPWMNSIFEKVEQRSNNKVKREYFAYAAIVTAALYLIIGSLAQIICNSVGFLYPAYASITALRSLGKDPAGVCAEAINDVSQWLTYWVVFALFSLIDLSVFANVPFYWLFKVAFLLYLYLPGSRGASFLYNNYIDPVVAQIENYWKPKTL